jgi:hypothetical protein
MIALLRKLRTSVQALNGSRTWRGRVAARRWASIWRRSREDSRVLFNLGSDEFLDE